MPGQSHSRDRHSDRKRTREREYIRGRYEDGDEGTTSSPSNARSGKYQFGQGESGYDSYDYGERDEEDEDALYEEERRRRERRERRRRREEERGYADPIKGRRRESSKAKESPATSPIKRRDRERDRDGHRRRRGDADEGSPVKDLRDRRYRSRGDENEERERSRDVDAEERRQRRRERERQRERDRVREQDLEAAAAVSAARKHQSTESASSASHLLSADALARLASEHEDEDRREHPRARDSPRKDRRQRKRAAVEGAAAGALGGELVEGRSRHKSGARVVSGAYLEEGRSPDMRIRHRGGGGPAMEDHWYKEGSWDGTDEGSTGPPAWKFWSSWSRKKRLWVGAIVAVILLLAIFIPVGVVVSKKKGSDSDSSSDSGPANSNLNEISRDSIPADAKGTVLDPFTWYDTEGFNVTYTSHTVGGLSVMGINSTWDDSARPNDKVPPLNEPFPYGSQPIRGVNVGGWLSIEPFISPSLFERYSSQSNVIDEWTLSEKLGDSAKRTIERHYSSFITESDFAEIKDAGLDHVRIQYSYWAVTTYDGDPYVAKIAWRYLLRAIEWCRKYGLRVNLDLHGVPGSQNGWNHSGHQGKINWIIGTDGALNRKRSLEVHDQLSKFFAQDRYKNIVTIYGLANEPFLMSMPVEKVLDWTDEAAKLVRKNGINATLVHHDGFLNLDKWKHMFKDHPDNMYLDTHQYTIFNTGEIVLNHTAKVDIVCNSWHPMIKEINTTSKGWGPTICGEWSQADTDCTKYLNNVGRGTRWEGTYDPKSTTAYCPTADNGPSCSCANANADLADYSDDYKKFLQTYAEAQMSAFETAQGWFYWTWRTESAAQWSYRTAWKNGFMPKKAYSPAFKCGDSIPDFTGLKEYY